MPIFHIREVIIVVVFIVLAGAQLLAVALHAEDVVLEGVALATFDTRVQNQAAVLKDKQEISN